MMVNRREFVAGAVSALTLGALETRAVGADGDWKAAFRAAGFDPDAPGCGTFAVVADCHVGNSDNAPFRDAVRLVNAMTPRPAFLLSCGDQLCFVSDCFGDRASVKRSGWRTKNDRDVATLKSIIAPLQIPFWHIIGNHDTYPDELDAAYYAGHFPGWKPYSRQEALGLQFLLLNAGHDGSFDDRQLAWMRAEKATLDPSRPLVLVAHQPSMCRASEYGVPQTIHDVFGDWPGELWFLGGHQHRDKLDRYTLPNGRPFGVITHRRGPLGFWLYGVRDGQIVARVLFEPTGLVTGEFGKSSGVFTGWKTPVAGKLPSTFDDRGPLPLPFDGCPNAIWKCLVGHDDDAGKKLLVTCMDHSDAGGWYFYLGKTIFRLPLAKAPGATRVGFVGSLRHHRKTKEHEKVYLSGDGETWTLCDEATPVKDFYAYGIPPALRGGASLYLRIDGFGFGNDSCVAGFAFLN